MFWTIKPYVEIIQINRNTSTIFAFITDVNNVSVMFEHIIDVTPNQPGACAIGSGFKQTRLVHGRRYRETVEVIGLIKEARYTLKMTNWGVETIYDYVFKSVSEQITQVHLTKTLHGRGLSKLLLPSAYHILTRPEHDGKHLTILKAAVEKSG